ncbi:MAG: uncharacterized protein JWM80_2219 [Cyanobacteria bacterium RYN_339]|nr:uncharacterized protein [Cyanobacteria bacterium RYN_339]
MTVTLDKVQKHAVDLRTGFPRSATEPLADYAIAARALDKCRAEIVGWQGDYHYDCPLSNIFLGYAGITPADFKAFVETGADDTEVAAWITEHATKRERIEILRWSNQWREKKVSELDDRLVLYMEDYVKDNCPPGAWSHIKTWFDIYDVEEKRIKV